MESYVHTQEKPEKAQTFTSVSVQVHRLAWWVSPNSRNLRHPDTIISSREAEKRNDCFQPILSFLYKSRIPCQGMMAATVERFSHFIQLIQDNAPQEHPMAYLPDDSRSHWADNSLSDTGKGNSACKLNYCYVLNHLKNFKESLFSNICGGKPQVIPGTLSE